MLSPVSYSFILQNINKQKIPFAFRNVNRLNFEGIEADNSLPSSNKKVKLVIFDFDGTLANTNELQKKAWRKLMGYLAEKYNDNRYWLTKEEEEETIGRKTREEIIDFILAKGKDSRNLSKDERKKLAKIKGDYTLDVLGGLSDKEISDMIMPGALDFIKKIHDINRENKKLGKQKIYMVIASNSSDTVSETLKKMGLSKYFNKKRKIPTLITSSDKGEPGEGEPGKKKLFKYPKPAPDIFKAAANLFNATPDECIVFEDSKTGFEAAWKAGMRCIAIGDTSNDKIPIFCRAKDFTKVNENFNKILRIEDEDESKLNLVG